MTGSYCRLTQRRFHTQQEQAYIKGSHNRLILQAHTTAVSHTTGTGLRKRLTQQAHTAGSHNRLHTLDGVTYSMFHTACFILHVSCSILTQNRVHTQQPSYTHNMIHTPKVMTKGSHDASLIGHGSPTSGSHKKLHTQQAHTTGFTQ